MCKKYSPGFIVLIIIAYIGLFTAILLNMIFSIKASRNVDYFKTLSTPEFRKKMNQTFIMNLKFDAELEDKDLCGECYRDKIHKWRNTTMKKYTRTFEIELLKDVISYKNNCSEGYKKCGKVNEYGDMLCLKLKEDEKCPINHIIINNNSTKGDDYQTFELGDKYVHFTTDKLLGNILTNITADEKKEKTYLDSASIKELKKYNPDIWSGYRNIFLYLIADSYTLPAKEELEDLIINYERREEYNSEKILEMNQKAKNFRKLLLFLGIFPFVLTAFIPIDIGTYFGCKGTDDKNCFENSHPKSCVEACCGAIFIMLGLCLFKYACTPCFKGSISQKRLSITLFILFLPVLLCSLICLIICFIKKSNYNEFLKMELIDDYKSGNILDDSLNKIKIMIVDNIIVISIFILYLLLSFISNKIKDDDNSDNYNTPHLLTSY